MSTIPDDPRRERWRQGSYEIVGDWFRSASIKVLDDLDLDGCRLLDLATGTGAVSIEAARRGARVTAVDLTPELLDIARRRAHDAEVSIDFSIGDFDHIHVDEPFDVVTSSFGVIFSADPAVTMAAISGYVRTGGTVVINAWAPDGAFGVLSPAVIELMVEPPPPTAGRWSTKSGIEAAISATPFVLAGQRNDIVEIPFESPADAVDQMIRWSGGWAQIVAALDESGRAEQGRDALIDHIARFGAVPAPADGSFVLAVGHVVSTLRRAS